VVEILGLLKDARVKHTEILDMLRHNNIGGNNQQG
jgi:hypothetical protein